MKKTLLIVWLPFLMCMSAPLSGKTIKSSSAHKGGGGASDTASESNYGIALDKAEALLEGKGESTQTDTPRGIYLLESEYTFNVLDSVYYDAGNHQLSLIGHFDKRFSGRRIPYLQHLATLLESPNPQFSLTWTADSEKRINGLFARHISQLE